MMTVFLLTLIFLLLMMAVMAVGVFVANKPIKGSCGGIQSLGMGSDCQICGGDPELCEEEQQRTAAPGGAGLANASVAQWEPDEVDDEPSSLPSRVYDPFEEPVQRR